MSRPSPSAPSLRRMKRSCPRMGWIRTMIRSICASCSSLEMEGPRGSLCMSGSRLYSRSSAFRSNLCRTKREHRMSMAISLKSSRSRMMATRSCEALLDHRDGRGGHLSLPCMPQRTRVLEQSDHELLCRDSKLLNSLYWESDRQRGPLRESRKRRMRLQRREQPLSRLVGVG